MAGTLTSKMNSFGFVPSPITPDVVTAAATQEDFRECRLYTRHFAKTFYFASHVLPAEKRKAAFALYAFCRFTDEMADSPEAVADRSHAARQLSAWRDRLDVVYSRVGLQDPKLRALQSTVMRYRIPKQYFADLIRGVEMDLTTSRFRTYAELDEYSYCVASTVGLMMTRVFSPDHEEEAFIHAIELGKAMQLTNILRDVGEDYGRGRIYLPQQDMQAFGVSEADLGMSLPGGNFARLMKFEIERARELYDWAEVGIPLLPDDGSRLCVKLMGRTYSRILDAIEKNNYDSLSRRAYVPPFKKLQIAFGAILG
jgi:15-cis-phytoene synthase